MVMNIEFATHLLLWCVSLGFLLYITMKVNDCKSDKDC